MASQPVHIINNIILAGAASDWQPEMLEELVNAVNTATVKAIGAAKAPDKDIGDCLLIEDLEPENAGEAWPPVKKLLERILLNTEQEEVCKWVQASRQGGGFFVSGRSAIGDLLTQVIDNESKGPVAKLAFIDGLVGLCKCDADEVCDMLLEYAHFDSLEVAKKWQECDLEKLLRQGATFDCLCKHFGDGVLPMIMTELDVSLPILEAALTKLGKGHERFFTVLEEKIITPLRAGKKPWFKTMVIEKATAAGENCSTWTAFRFV